MTPERWCQVEEIYNLALEHEAGQRSEFLKQACSGDEQMLREIESLLAHQEHAEEFMKAPGMSVLAQTLAQDRTGSMIGRRIGPYQILSLTRHSRNQTGFVYHPPKRVVNGHENADRTSRPADRRSVVLL